MANKAAGFEVLIADGRFFVDTPWKEGGDLRMALQSNPSGGGGGILKLWRVERGSNSNSR